MGVKHVRELQTPELDKRSEAMDELRKPHEVLTDFLVWLDEQGVELAEWVKVDEFEDEQLLHSSRASNREKLLCEFFGLDYERIGQEQKELLEAIRK